MKSSIYLPFSPSSLLKALSEDEKKQWVASIRLHIIGNPMTALIERKRKEGLQEAVKGKKRKEKEKEKEEKERKEKEGEEEGGESECMPQHCRFDDDVSAVEEERRRTTQKMIGILLENEEASRPENEEIGDSPHEPSHLQMKGRPDRKVLLKLTRAHCETKLGKNSLPSHFANTFEVPSEIVVTANEFYVFGHQYKVVHRDRISWDLVTEVRGDFMTSFKAVVKICLPPPNLNISSLSLGKVGSESHGSQESIETVVSTSSSSSTSSSNTQSVRASSPRKRNDKASQKYPLKNPPNRIVQESKPADHSSDASMPTPSRVDMESGSKGDDENALPSVEEDDEYFLNMAKHPHAIDVHTGRISVLFFSPVSSSSSSSASLMPASPEKEAEAVVEQEQKNERKTTTGSRITPGNPFRSGSVTSVSQPSLNEVSTVVNANEMEYHLTFRKKESAEKFLSTAVMILKRRLMTEQKKPYLEKRAFLGRESVTYVLHPFGLSCTDWLRCVTSEF